MLVLKSSLASPDGSFGRLSGTGTQFYLGTTTVNIIPSMGHTPLHLQGFSLQKDKLATPEHLATKLMLCLKSGTLNGEKQVLSWSCQFIIKTDSWLFNRIQNIIRLFISMFLTPILLEGMGAGVCQKFQPSFPL